MTVSSNIKRDISSFFMNSLLTSASYALDSIMPTCFYSTFHMGQTQAWLHFYQRPFVGLPSLSRFLENVSSFHHLLADIRSWRLLLRLLSNQVLLVTYPRAAMLMYHHPWCRFRLVYYLPGIFSQLFLLHPKISPSGFLWVDIFFRLVFQRSSLQRLLHPRFE